MASIPFGIEFDRIAPDLPPVLNTAAAAGYDAARRRQTIVSFFLNDFGLGASVDSSGSTATLRTAGIGASHPLPRALPKSPFSSHSGHSAGATGTGLHAPARTSSIDEPTISASAIG